MADGTRTTSGSPQGGAAARGLSGGGDKEGRDRVAQAGDDSAAAVVTEAKKVGSELVGAVRESVTSVLDTQRNRAAEQIATIGEALKRSARSFDKTSGSAVAGYADRAAEQITGFAETVRSRSWGDLGSDVEDFARRWPIAFIASAAGIGFVAGRFMLSSAERTREKATSTASKPHMGGPTQRPATGSPGTHAAGATASDTTKSGFGTTSAGE
jgi:hypothetical protein